jgi:hypothetical protein
MSPILRPGHPVPVTRASTTKMDIGALRGGSIYLWQPTPEENQPSVVMLRFNLNGSEPDFGGLVHTHRDASIAFCSSFRVVLASEDTYLDLAWIRPCTHE